MSNVTQILGQIESGDPSAAERLLPLIYEELRKLAAARMADERSDHTLQATALVHEAYLRLVGNGQQQAWDSRGHFFAAAAEAMRRILVEHARKNGRREEIRGPRIPLDELDTVASFQNDRLLELDEALQALEIQNPIAAKLVKLRFFTGLNMSETAHALSLPLRTTERTWTYARVWLHRELENRRSEE